MLQRGVIITREKVFSLVSMAFVRCAGTNACHCCTGNMNTAGYTSTATSGLQINPSEDPTKILVKTAHSLSRKCWRCFLGNYSRTGSDFQYDDGVPFITCATARLSGRLPHTIQAGARFGERGSCDMGVSPAEETCSPHKLSACPRELFPRTTPA
jgi:hypothetical protein